MLIKAPAIPHGVTWGDGIEIVGVFVVLALYVWVAAALVRPGAPWPRVVPFLFLVALTSYALGHGMHVAANSIHDMMAETGAADGWGLATFWDEGMGHVLADVARVLFVVALLVLERSGSAGSSPGEVGDDRMIGVQRLLTIAGAVAYGFIQFATSVEGQTVYLALPFCAVLAILGIASRSAPPGHAPVRSFFTAAAFVSLLLFAIWGVWQRGFPEFTRAGIL